MLFPTQMHFFVCSTITGLNTLNRGILLNSVLCNSYKKEKRSMVCVYDCVLSIIACISDSREPPNFDWAFIRNKFSPYSFINV